jgi:RHS repeat-associated protein
MEIADTQGLLSWSPSAVTPAPNALTVMFWAKIVIPDVTNFQLTEDMTLVGNRRTGDWTQNHAYRFYFNANTGNLEFTAKGASGALPAVKLIERPYLDRWYHLAAVRSGSNWAFYVDGRAIAPPAGLPDIGSMNTTDGVSIGGLLTNQRFYGEIQELAVFQRALTQNDIATNRLKDIPTNFTGLRGYYKLGYSATASDNLKNFAVAPPSPLTAVPDATKQGSGVIDFPETDKQGEQSLFDSQKNQGRDAQSPLSGTFTWQRTLISRPTAGVPFEFRIGYNSGISFNSQALENGADMFYNEAVLGPGWRHSFQTRIIPGQQYLATGGGGYVGLLLWDGSLETWQRIAASRNYKTMHGEYRGELQESVEGDALIWVTPERLIYRFYHPYNESDQNLAGKLKEISDFNGNKVSLTYEPNQGLLDTVTDTAGTVWQFNYNAQTLLSSVTSLGWTITFTYDGSNRLQTFYHRGPAIYEASPVLNTTWTVASYGGPNGLLTQLNNPRGYADIQVSYDKYGRKTAETDGGNRSTLYTYLSPGARQVTRTDGDGKKWVETFDRKGHVTAKTDPLGNTLRYEFYATADKDIFNNTIPTVGVLKRQIEPLGWITTFDAYDERGNLLQKTDAIGKVWKWTFPKITDPAGANGKLTEVLPAESTSTPVASLLNRPITDTRPRVAGETSDWSNRYLFDAQGNLLSHTDDIGTLAAYTYDSRGLVLTSKDANYSPTNLSGTTNTYYPNTGFLQTSTDPAGNVTTFDYTELGWLKSTKNALQQTVTQEFNINGQAIRTTNAMGQTTATTFDEVGNARFALDAKLQQSESQYDGSNLRTWAKDRAGNISTTGYNNRSLPTSGTSPSVPISQPSGPPVSQQITAYRSYDDTGRPYRETDSNGDYVEHTYDANGNEIATRDRIGRIRRKQYDRLNRPVVTIDPLGNTNFTTYDEAGRLLTTTNPNGNTTSHEYDGRGRLTKWTDPEAFVWIYTYDGLGNITDIEDARHEHYKMTYDVRGLRKTEENQDHLLWTYTYDELGRLKTQDEPTGITRTLTYDQAGRLLLAQCSTGRQNILGYDDNGNVMSAIRIEAGTVQLTFTTFAYDSLDRPKSSTDTYGQKVGYDYDALGHVTTLTYPGNRTLSQEFDNLGRLVRQSTSSIWGSHVLNYTWDKEGRLVGQTYPNGMSRAATYDDSGRQTSLTYTDGKGTTDTADDSIQMALNYAYDNNGNQTSAKEKGLLAYIPPTPHDETSAYTPGGRLQTRTDAADSTGAKNWTYEFKNADNTPSFNLSKATCPSVGSLALTYDEDNRTTSLELTNPQNVKSTIQNRYDALGRRISRSVTAGGTTTETRYILNLIGGMERILADTTSTGQITALYLHGPDLAVKVDPVAPANITCYHADASGNIVRLTDKDRGTVSQYAYSDYGQTFAKSSAPSITDTNPYRFVGSQGVMEEGLVSGLTFMRARYYLADAGVFLSVDPVKNIGPNWKPETYGYSGNNPIKSFDPQGTDFMDSAISVGEDWREIRDWGTHALAATSIYFNPIGAEDFVRGFAVGGVEGFAYEQLPANAEDIVDAVDTINDIVDLPKKGLKKYIQEEVSMAPYNSGKIAGKYTYGLARVLTDKEAEYFQGLGSKINAMFTNSSSKTNSTLGAAKQAQANNKTTSTLPAAATWTSGSVSTTGNSRSYSVSSGQTFNGIAQSLGISSSALRALNPQITNYDKINVNQIIKVPPTSSGGASNKSGTASKPGATTTSSSSKSGKK